jgi:queuine tRNA-ribosyltransferase
VYLRHLFQSGEILASILASHHNLAHYLDTMRQIRQAIKLGALRSYRARYLEALGCESERTSESATA